MARGLAMVAAFAVLAAVVLVGCGEADRSAGRSEERGARAEIASGDPGQRSAASRQAPGAGATDGGALETSAAGGGAPSDHAGEAADSESGGGEEGALPPRATREAALVRNLIYELVDGLNAGDPSVCSRLFSQHLLDEEQRAPFLTECESRTAEAKVEVELVRIEIIDIRSEGDARGAFVQFLLEMDGEQLRYLFRVTRSAGRYRIDAVLPVKQPG